MTLRNSKLPTPNFPLLLLVFCLPFVATLSQVHAEDAEQYQAKLRQIAETPFAGTPDEYKTFSQDLGDSLMQTADAMLTLTDLSPEEIRYAILMKYWGLVRKYGFDQNELDEQLEGFAAEIEDVPGMTDLYKTIMENLYFSSRLDLLYNTDDPDAKAAAFIKYRDRFIPFMEKYCTEEDDRQLTFILGQVMQFCDNDGSFGLVESTVEKLMPLLKKQENSRWEKSNSLMVQGMLHRVQLTGNEIEYKGVSTTGELIDVKDFRGKLVFLNMNQPRNEKLLAVHKKLYDALYNSGLVIIQHDVMDSREVARKKAEDAELPWIITCRGARHEKNLEDYYKNWGLTRALFLIDRDGIVIRSWSNGFCPAACKELKKLFPEHSDVLSEITAELVQQEQELKNEMAKWSEKSQNPQANELNEMRSAMMSAAAPRGNMHFPDVLTSQIYAKTLLELANALLSTPQTTQEQWGWGARSKLDALSELAQQQIKDHPEMKPEEVFKVWEHAIDELEQSPHASGYFNTRIQLLFEMHQYLNRMTDAKADYAREIQKRWIALNQKEIELQKSLPKEKQNIFLLNHYNNMFPRGLIDSMEEIDEDGSQGLAVSFCDELATLLEDSGHHELREIAEHLKGTARRSGSVGKEFEFECILMNDEKINVKDLRGKIVLVNFWATTCGPCIREFPNMKTQYEKYKPQGYEMIALSTDADIETIAEFQEANDYPWLVGSYVKSKDAGLVDYYAYYGIQGVPTTFLLDRDGKVVFRMVGSDDDRLNLELEKAFAE